jgi:hypothetical protein
MHLIACRLSYFASSMHGIDKLGRLIMTFGGIMADTIEWTPKSLVLNWIACRLSYFAFYMHIVGVYGLLIVTFEGGWSGDGNSLFVSSLWHRNVQNWIYSNSSHNASNHWQIFLLCILNALHWHIWDFDNDFRGYMIPFMAIPCIGFFRMQISDETYSKDSCTLSNYSKDSCTISIWLRIVLFHILYAWHWHIWSTDNDFWGWMILVMAIPWVFIVAQ